MSLKQKRVYMVEDDVNNRAIIQMLLEQAGARVEFDRWGKETASRILRALPIDLILLDLMFPNGISGFDVYQDLRALPEVAHLPIIAVSASDASASIPRAQALGFNGYIAKPISFHHFVPQIERILAGESLWIDSL